MGQIFLLAGEKPTSTAEMIDTIAKHLDTKGSLVRNLLLKQLQMPFCEPERD